jgi:hypothetical protein
VTDTPPDWILIEAAKRFAWDNVATSRLRSHYHDENYIGFRALCDMIAKHEQKPVDRKLLCAQEAVRLHNERHAFSHGLHTPEEVCVRAIHLFEEGFGK